KDRPHARHPRDGKSRGQILVAAVQRTSNIQHRTSNFELMAAAVRRLTFDVQCWTFTSSSRLLWWCNKKPSPRPSAGVWYSGRGRSEGTLLLLSCISSRSFSSPGSLGREGPSR